MPTARALRVKLKMPQKELARRAGVSYGTVLRWEKGEAVSPGTAGKLADALNTPLDQITGVSIYEAVLARNKGVLED